LQEEERKVWGATNSPQDKLQDALFSKNQESLRLDSIWSSKTPFKVKLSRLLFGASFNPVLGP